MTVRNIYFLAAYGLWIYILLCLAVKLLGDRLRRAVAGRRMKYIRRYFAPGGNGTEEREKQDRRLLRWGRDPLLLTCACLGYQKGLPRYTDGEKSRFRALLSRMLLSASETEKTVEEVCAVNALAECCGISMRTAARPAGSSAMAAFWRRRRREREAEKA